MQTLLEEIKNCRTCSRYLSAGVNPVVAATTKSRIIIIGQAPGRIVHNTGIPWNDKSGDNLRKWMGLDKDTFYNPELVALMPMGFCYPGKGKSGDMPPRIECAPLWHEKLLTQMPHIELCLLVGKYAQQYYLGTQAQQSLTETVKHFQDHLPRYFALPHPSPRNNIWQKKNEWFAKDVLPQLKERVQQILSRIP